MKKWISVLLMMMWGASLIGCSTMNASSPEKNEAKDLALKDSAQEPQKSNFKNLTLAELPSTQWFVNDMKQDDMG